MKITKVIKKYKVLLLRKNESLDSYYDYQVAVVGGKGEQGVRREMGEVGEGRDRIELVGGVWEDGEKGHSELGVGVDSMMVSALKRCFQLTGLYFTKDPIFQQQKLRKLTEIKLQYITASFLNKSPQTQLNNPLSSNFFTLLATSLPPSPLIPFYRLIAPSPSCPTTLEDTQIYLHLVEPFSFVNLGKFSENQKLIHSTQPCPLGEERVESWWDRPLALAGRYLGGGWGGWGDVLALGVMAGCFKREEFREWGRGGTKGLGGTKENIVHLKEQKGGYVGVMLGDAQFPYRDYIGNQNIKDISEEIQKFYVDNANRDEHHKIRFLLQNPSDLFSGEFSSECTMQGSILNKFKGSSELRELINKIQ